MKKRLFLFYFLVANTLLVFLFIPKVSLAKIDLSVTVTDLTFSKDEALEGDKIRIFARVFNVGDVDVYGFVLFLDNGKEMAVPQPISVRINTYDDVFIDWIAKAGSHDIKAKIISTNPLDDNSANNEALKENYFVDLDSDKDGTGNTEDWDDDNDGLSDESEASQGTDPLKPDTDADKVKDSVDPFPLDSAEWQDSDNDGIGNNADTDDDNDGLLDEDEIFAFATNPLNADSDNDGLSDKKETDVGTSPVKSDTDGDGVNDSEDEFPLDPSRAQASLLASIFGFVPEDWLIPILVGASLLILLFLFLPAIKRRLKRKREED